MTITSSLRFLNIFWESGLLCVMPWLTFRECFGTGAAGARTRRSLAHHLLHPQILRPRALFYKKDCTRSSEFLTKAMGPNKPMEFICANNRNFFLFLIAIMGEIFFIFRKMLKVQCMYLYMCTYNVDS